MTDVRAINRAAWDNEVEKGNPWTIPVTREEIDRARTGDLRILLTPSRFVPLSWYPPLAGARVLCLASGGGQQGPLLAAAGARVTVYDNSPKQLERDCQTANAAGLELETIEGDMRDLGALEDAAFDCIVHPVSNTFVPDIRPVWREAYRVLKPGGVLLSGFDNPLMHLFDTAAYEENRLEVKYPIPYSDLHVLSPEQVEARRTQGPPLEFGHTLDDQIGGQLDAGFLITGFYEDRYPEEENDLLSQYIATFMATRACKPHAAGDAASSLNPA